MTFTIVLSAFFISSTISFVAGGVINVDINRKPANLSEAGEIICALKDKLTTCEQLLRENRWPLLVRGQIDRLSDRYASGITLSDDDMKEVKAAGEDSKKRKRMRMMVCERLMNLTNYAEIAQLRARIDEAHLTDEEITPETFCEAISDTYECISENGAPYLSLLPGEKVPKIMSRLLTDNVNKYLNILMKNADETPVKEYVPKGNKGSNGTTVADSKQSSVTPAAAGPESGKTAAPTGKQSANATASVGKESVKSTASVGKPSANATASAGKESVKTTASVGNQSVNVTASDGKENLKTTTAAGDIKKNTTKV